MPRVTRVTGLLADSEQEWEFRMEQLIKDAKLRRTLGKQAKQYVLDSCNIEVNIKRYDEVYRAIIENHGKQAQRQSRHDI